MSPDERRLIQCHFKWKVHVQDVFGRSILPVEGTSPPGSEAGGGGDGGQEKGSPPLVPPSPVNAIKQKPHKKPHAGNWV